MNNNYSVRILEASMDVFKIQDSINNKLFNFITRASELVKLSEDMYQIEKSIELNKISLKGYILDSPCCKLLEQNNISNYSIDELKQYLTKYEQTSNDDCLSYHLAIKLYELLDEIEKLVDEKIDLEVTKVAELEPQINDIRNVNSGDFESLYNQIKLDLTNDYLNQNLIDNKAFDICIQFMNDIFNYCISGYPDIPTEFF